MDRLEKAQKIADGVPVLGMSWTFPIAAGFLFVAIELVSLIKTAIDRETKPE